MTVIERVAKAIRFVYGKPIVTDAESKDLARVAIAAMREPTEAQYKAVYGSRIRCIRNHDVSDTDLRLIWQVMIDAALEEK